MEPVLFVDAGNSAVKVARPGAAGSWRVESCRYDVLAPLSALPAGPAIGVSVVPERNAAIEQALGRSVRWIALSDFSAGMIDYATPHTLGLDRLVAAMGAKAVAGGGNVVLVDSGSAVTLDLIDAAGVFRGGVIAPGLAAFESGLAARAPRLPVVARTVPHQFPGRSTVECLQWGLTGGFAAMLESLIRRYMEGRTIHHIVLTGGDAALVAPFLPPSWPVSVHETVIFDGLALLATVW